MNCVSCTEITNATGISDYLQVILHLEGTFGCSRSSAGGCVPGWVVGTGSCLLESTSLRTDGTLLSFIRCKDYVFNMLANNILKWYFSFMKRNDQTQVPWLLREG